MFSQRALQFSSFLLISCFCCVEYNRIVP